MGISVHDLSVVSNTLWLIITGTTQYFKKIQNNRETRIHVLERFLSQLNEETN
jgi:hypothetical protein